MEVSMARHNRGTRALRTGAALVLVLVATAFPPLSVESRAGEGLVEGVKEGAVEVGKEAKEMGKEIGAAAKKTGIAVGEKAKEAGIAVGEAAKETGREAGKAFKETGKAISEGVQGKKSDAGK